MNFRYVLILCNAMIGVVMLFVGTALEIKFSQRQPATVTMVRTACELLPAKVALPAGDGLCRFETEDFKYNGQFIDLWLAEGSGEFFEGKTIVVPASTMKVAVELPKRATPLWIHIAFGVGMILVLGTIVAFGLEIRRSSALRSKGNR